MARSRNIKPGFFQNEELGELDPLARLLFIGMWTIADFKGCIEYRPKRLKVQLLPYDNCDIDELTINLDSSGFISIYSVQGQKYIKIINFDVHQNPHKNEREAGSEIPDLDKNDNEIISIKNIRINPDKNGTARADSLLPDSLNHSTTLSGKPNVDKKVAIEILDYLNLKAGRKYKPVKSNISMIEARLKEFSHEELIAVVDDRCTAWAADSKMVSYLRPETLFNATKCAGYVGSLGLTVAKNGGKPWYLMASGIEAKAKELKIVNERDEPFHLFKVRVYQAAKITPEMVRKANQDYR